MRWVRLRSRDRDDDEDDEDDDAENDAEIPVGDTAAWRAASGPLIGWETLASRWGDSKR